MRKKVPLAVKMEALKLLQSGMSVQSVSKQLGVLHGELQTWSLIYEKEGEKGLASYPKNICIGSIKDKIICTYRQKNVPLHRKGLCIFFVSLQTLESLETLETLESLLLLK